MNLPVPLKYWNGIREGIYQALEMITDDQLVFSPAGSLWPLGQVALHIASAEDGWFRFIIRRELQDWPADLALANHPTVSAVRDRLVQVHAATQAYLGDVDHDELERTITAPWGSTFPVRWAIWHVLEHEIHHRGEIYLMLGMLGKEAPDV